MTDLAKLNCKICGGPQDILAGVTHHTMDCPFYAGNIIEAGPDVELIDAQRAGENLPLSDYGADLERRLEEWKRDFRKHVESLIKSEEIETSGNFGFYVDGYTLASTDKIGEIKLTAMDGRTKVVTSRALTDWIERRLPGLEPNKD